MKRIIIAALLFIAATFAAVPAQAQIRPGLYSISGLFGGYYFDSEETHLRKYWVTGVRVGHDFTDRWGVEAVYDIVSTHIKVKNSTVRSFGYRIDGIYYFMPDQRLVPFVAAGVGGTTLRMPVGVRDDTDKLINYGAGIKYFLTNYLVFRADIRHLHIFDGMRDDLEYTLGLTLLFDFFVPRDCPECVAAATNDSDGDGVPDYLDKCPGTPKGVPVDANGCPLDSDGDGVPDYLDKCPGTEKGVQCDEHGCPPMEKGVVITRILNMQFEFGKADIKPEYYDELGQIADFLQTYPQTSATIVGHTDIIGTVKYNQRLSERRAESVRRYLVETFGIAKNRLSIKGYGYLRPVADNSTPEGRQKNRRIRAVFEVTVFK